MIVTRNTAFKAPNGYKVVYSPEEAIQYLGSQDIETMFLIGGGTLNSEFMKKNLIDELQLTIVPHLIGTGRPVFARNEFEKKLMLVKAKQLVDGRVELQYLVQK